MLESTRVQLRINELQEEETRLQNKANEPRFMETRKEDPDHEQRLDEHKAIVAHLTETRDSLLAQYRKQSAALEQEDKETQAVMARNVSTEGWTPELREFRSIGQKDQHRRLLRGHHPQPQRRGGGQGVQRACVRLVEPRRLPDRDAPGPRRVPGL